MHERQDTRAPGNPPVRPLYPFRPADGQERPTEYVTFGTYPFVRTAAGGWRPVDSAEVAGAVELED